MLGSGPGDGDVIGMGSDEPRRPWMIGRRTRLALVAAGVCVLVAAGAAFTAVQLNARGAPGRAADRALAQLVTQVTTVPEGSAIPAAPAVSDGGYYYESSSSSTSAAYSSHLSFAFSAVSPVSGPPLTAGRKPEVLYVDAGYCPYCVAENWALIVALSRFGTFTGLSTSRSPRLEEIGPIDGWSFYGSSYASPYLAFVPVETRSSVLATPKAAPAKATSYRVLQRLTPAEQAVFRKFDGLRQTPFFDFGGRATMLGANVSPPTLAGLTWSQIAADLRRPQTEAGMTILGAADVLTAEFCRLTGGRPAAACSG